MDFPTLEGNGLICIYINVLPSYIDHEVGDIIEITSVEKTEEDNYDYEGQTCVTQLSQKIIGIIPDENGIAILFNTENNGETFGDYNILPEFGIDIQAVGIKGIGIVKVLGKVKKGQALVSSGFSGSARGIKNLGEMNFSFGFALETKITNDIASIKCYLK